MHKLSHNIRHLRKLRGLTQEQFADELNITRSRVGSYEEGRSEPSVELLIKIADYFRVPIDILVKNDLRKAKENAFIELGNQRVAIELNSVAPVRVGETRKFTVQGEELHFFDPQSEAAL